MIFFIGNDNILDVMAANGALPTSEKSWPQFLHRTGQRIDAAMDNTRERERRPL